MDIDARSSPIYGGLRPEHIPAYSFADASRYLAIHISTLRAWFLGTKRRGVTAFEPVLELSDPQQRFLSFENLVEAHVLGSLRRVHGIKMDRVREAIRFLADTWRSSHPLAREEMLVDGRDLLAERFGRLFSLSESGQLAMKRILEQYLVRIERDPQGVPVRLYPMSRQHAEGSPRIITIDPAVQFGRPCIADSGVPTEEIIDRLEAGDAIDDLARDFARSTDEIVEAIRYELLASKAA